MLMAQNQYPLRLPAYRSSYRLRYHPYPRYVSSTTVDYRDHDLAVVPEVSQPLIIEEDSNTANLQQAISGEQSESPARALSTLVIELAFAVRRKLTIIDVPETAS